MHPWEVETARGGRWTFRRQGRRRPGHDRMRDYRLWETSQQPGRALIEYAARGAAAVKVMEKHSLSRIAL